MLLKLRLERPLFHLPKPRLMQRSISETWLLITIRYAQDADSEKRRSLREDSRLMEPSNKKSSSRLKGKQKREDKVEEEVEEELLSLKKPPQPQTESLLSLGKNCTW